MALVMPQAKNDLVSFIEIKIGNEHVKHSFGRQVSIHTARKWAQHYLDAMTLDKETTDDQ